MKPSEFWNSTYREVNIYTQACLAKKLDDFKEEIKLQEAVTDKLILADAMSNKHPKIFPLQKQFEKLFLEDKEEKIQSTEEIIRRMRQIMNASKK